jgi:hypothetical protein
LNILLLSCCCTRCSAANYPDQAIEPAIEDLAQCLMMRWPGCHEFTFMDQPVDTHWLSYGLNNLDHATLMWAMALDLVGEFHQRGEAVDYRVIDVLEWCAQRLSEEWGSEISFMLQAKTLQPMLLNRCFLPPSPSNDLPEESELADIVRDSRCYLVREFLLKSPADQWYHNNRCPGWALGAQ